MKKFNPSVLFLSVSLLTSKAYAMEKDSYDNIFSSKSFQEKVRMRPEHFEKVQGFRKDLHETKNQYNDNIETLENLTTGKNIVVCIGNTGAGKSTTLNLLTSNKSLKADMAGYGIEDAYFKIGEGSTSETLLPKAREYSGQVFVDLPGLGDSRGDAIAFLNAIYINSVLTKANSVTFLFIESKGTLESNRGYHFKTLLDTTSKLIEDPRILKNSSACIFTKADTHIQNTFVNDFLKKKVDSECIENLENFTSLENVLPFIHSSKFIIEDEDTGEKTVDEVKKERLLLKFKESVEQKLSSLKSVRVPHINQGILLNPGTSELITGLFRVSIAEIIEKTKPDLNQLSYNVDELKELNRVLSQKARQNFEEKVANQKELIFVKQFDNKIYEEEKERSLKDLDSEITIIKESLGKKIAEEERKEAEQKRIEIEELRLQEEINNKERLEEIKRVNEETLEKQQKLFKEEEKKRDEVHKKAQEELAKIIEKEQDEKTKEILENQRKENEEKARIREEQYKKEQKENEERLKKEKDDAIKQQNEAHKKLQEENNKRIEEQCKREKEAEDNKRRIEEKQKEREKELAYIAQTPSYRQICNKIDNLFSNLSSKKEEWDNERKHNKEKSTAGSIVKGIFSLGIHTAYHSSREENLEKEYGKIKNELRDNLNEYKTIMLGNAHRRDNEI